MFRGLDPLVFCGICGVVSAGAGYALGTQLFKILWKFMNRSQAMMLLEVCKMVILCSMYTLTVHFPI